MPTAGQSVASNNGNMTQGHKIAVKTGTIDEIVYKTKGGPPDEPGAGHGWRFHPHQGSVAQEGVPTTAASYN